MARPPLGDFGAPPDAAAWGALVLALLLLAVPGVRTALARLSDRSFVALAAVGALLLSLGYVDHYLRGGPRIIDAASYFLEGRMLAEGAFGMPLASPSGSFRGRFLLPDPTGQSLSVIFPPGYPALLALGFLAGAPLLVGPLLAAILVVVTFSLARKLSGRSDVARLAATLSVCSAALRYHTADTMSHGLAAALMGGAVLAGLGTRPRHAALAGFLAGWLVATRPPSGIVGLVLVAFLLRASAPRLGIAAVSAAIPVGLFVLQQSVATGAAFGSTQLAYYALADGPPGCFRYGFGANIGCLFEHGDFVRARLRDGFGLLAALGTTLRRLQMHLSDAANLELLVVPLVAGLRDAWGRGAARVLALGVAGTIVVYVPFYFDGNYPGGGARFYADVLPLEHVALALAAAGSRLERFVLPAVLAGFALHSSHDHVRLRDREGGRPMFEERVLARAEITRGLVLVDTDHGFALGARPGPSPGEIVVARRRRDAHDVLLWNALGRPPVYEYEFPFTGTSAEPAVTPLSLELTFPLRFEAEAEWPPLSVRGGSATPDFPGCASGRQGLRLEPSPGPVTVRLDLPAPEAARYLLRVAWVVPTSAGAVPRIEVGGVRVDAPLEPGPPGCRLGVPFPVELREGSNPAEITSGSPVVVDYLEIDRP